MRFLGLPVTLIGLLIIFVTIIHVFLNNHSKIQHISIEQLILLHRFYYTVAERIRTQIF